MQSTPRQRHRQQTSEEILDAALGVMREEGVAGLNLTEVARRVGLRQPSVYQYFDSRTAVYDALFERGMQTHLEIVTAAIGAAPKGWAAVRSAMTSTLQFAGEQPELAQLLFTRAVPGFEPSPQAYAPSVRVYEIVHDAVEAAVELGELHPAAGSARGLALLFSLVAGVFSQQFANKPDSSLMDPALDMYACYFRADRRAGWTP
jgi:AcrR family transcriptional regulator